MKTKTRSLIIIVCALGLVGTLNANAAISNNTSCIAASLEEAKNLKFENLNSSAFVFTEDADSKIDYEMEAQLVTKWVADKEEEKVIKMLFNNLIFVSNEEAASLTAEEESVNLNSDEFVFADGTDSEIDYEKEAQLVTKWVADKEEAKAFQKLIDAGTIAENR